MIISLPYFSKVLVIDADDLLDLLAVLLHSCFVSSSTQFLPFPSR
jgi:hypothetical protein